LAYCKVPDQLAGHCGVPTVEFVATVTVTTPLMDPLDGDTTAQAESDAAVQLVLEVTVMG
jgi:hypothetical protein